MNATAGLIHVAGVDAQMNGHVRQRCAWCGAMLIERHQGTPASLDSGRTPGTWAVGTLVQMLPSGSTMLVEHEEGKPLPDGACGRLDPEVTR